MDNSMDQWPQSTQNVPGMSDPSGLYNPEDWEDWLRWDPTTESLSPDNSSKDSSDSPIHDASSMKDGSLGWLSNDQILAPALIAGDDSSMLDLTAGLDTSALNFSGNETTIDPFIFSASNSLQPVYEHLNTEPLSKRKDSTLWPSGQALGSHNQDKLPLTSAQHTTTASRPASQYGNDSGSQAPSSVSSLSPQPTAPPKKKAGRKRKSELAAAEGGNSGDGEPPVKKTSHNVIEKRYRNNLNDKILELRDSVPSLRAMSKPGEEEDDEEDLEGLAPAHKLNKSTIMAKATEYIRHLEKRNKTLADEMDSLKERLAAVEQGQARNMAISDRANLSSSPIASRSRQPSIHLNNFNATSSPLSPEAQMRQRNFMQQPMSSTFNNAIDDDNAQQKFIKGNSGSNFMGKLMVGSMAGLMVMEGFVEHSQDSQSSGGKGLAAAPLHLLKRGSLAADGPASTLLPALKLSLVLTALVYLVLPLFRSKPKPKTKAVPHITLTAVPSLSSPVEIRRKAWLTAIQSVWTPKPYLLEVAVVGVRMAELSLRRLVGFDRYAELLGMTKDDEAARIKAWDIAIDAQLAGGDAEVSYYRLLLTLMASGTLPDSPIRLMQKAVHFRVFFWEVANAGYGNMSFFKDFTAKVGKIYWDSARRQQKDIMSGAASKTDELGQAIELLPDHLAALVELECDEVLTDDMIQRAYNLAWNRPSAENTTASPTLDKVVEDPAVRSPLDAVAAWFSNTIVDESLALSLHTEASTGNDVEYLVKLATSTAPPASSTFTRATVAKAVLLDEAREANIAAALESMPHAPVASPLLSASSTTLHLDVVNHVPLTPEVRTALTLAKLLSIAEAANPTSSQSRAATALRSMSIGSSQFTLLTAVAAHKVLDRFSTNPLLFSYGKSGLEQLAFNLRLWVGARAGKTAGLQREEKGRLVDRCLAVTKKIGGWRDADEVDSGYGSGRSRRGSDEVTTS